MVVLGECVHLQQKSGCGARGGVPALVQPPQRPVEGGEEGAEGQVHGQGVTTMLR